MLDGIGRQIAQQSEQGRGRAATVLCELLTAWPVVGLRFWGPACLGDNVAAVCSDHVSAEDKTANIKAQEEALRKVIISWPCAPWRARVLLGAC